MKATAQDSSVREIADAVGIMSSMLCALHCLIVPMTLLFGPIGALSLVGGHAEETLFLCHFIPEHMFGNHNAAVSDPCVLQLLAVVS